MNSTSARPYTARQIAVLHILRAAKGYAHRFIIPVNDTIVDFVPATNSFVWKATLLSATVTSLIKRGALVHATRYLVNENGEQEMIRVIVLAENSDDQFSQIASKDEAHAIALLENGFEHDYAYAWNVAYNIERVRNGEPRAAGVLYVPNIETAHMMALGDNETWAYNQTGRRDYAELMAGYMPAREVAEEAAYAFDQVFTQARARLAEAALEGDQELAWDKAYFAERRMNGEPRAFIYNLYVSSPEVAFEHAADEDVVRAERNARHTAHLIAVAQNRNASPANIAMTNLNPYMRRGELEATYEPNPNICHDYAKGDYEAFRAGVNIDPDYFTPEFFAANPSALRPGEPTYTQTISAAWFEAQREAQRRERALEATPEELVEGMIETAQRAGTVYSGRAVWAANPYVRRGELEATYEPDPALCHEWALVEQNVADQYAASVAALGLGEPMIGAPYDTPERE